MLLYVGDSNYYSPYRAEDSRVNVPSGHSFRELIEQLEKFANPEVSEIVHGIG
jgi:hypothetical protein